MTINGKVLTLDEIHELTECYLYDDIDDINDVEYEDYDDE